MRSEDNFSPTRDAATVRGFGQEWRRFDQTALDATELQAMWDRYFAFFPWEELPKGARGVDIGCGSGRWAALVVPRVSQLICVDPSAEALRVAQRRLSATENCHLVLGAAGELPFSDGSFDFAYSLGVLHHSPDPQAALDDCARVLRPGGVLLLYLYYAFDNRPPWFRAMWRVSDVARRVISRFPFGGKYLVSQLIALVVYWPLARVALLLDRAGRDVSSFPLSFYRRDSLYTMRTDALDRFGTRLEHRFSRDEIEGMMSRAGLGRVEFSPSEPHWCAVGRRL